MRWSYEEVAVLPNREGRGSRASRSGAALSITEHLLVVHHWDWIDTRISPNRLERRLKKMDCKLV